MKGLLRRRRLLLVVAVVGAAAAFMNWRASIKTAERERTALRAEGFPPLIVAVNADDLDEVRRLLREGKNVNGWYGKENDSPLHFARSRRMVELLLESGADPNVRNAQKEAPLHTVRVPGAAEALIEAGADPLAVDEIRETPLHDAPNEELVNLLVAAGADVNAADHHGRTPLISAQNGGVVAALLRHGADAMKRDSRGLTAVHYARDRKSIKLMLKAGLTAREKGEIYGEEPLQFAQNAVVVRTLLSEGGSITATDKLGRTPWVQANSIEVLEELLVGGAGIDSEWKGSTKLSQSLLSEKFDIALFLLERGASLPADSKTWSRVNDTAVLLALARSGADHSTLRVAGVSDLETVRWLLSRGALVDPPPELNLGWPLADSPNVEIARLLLASGAQTIARSPDSHSSKITLLRAVLRRWPPAPREVVDLVVPYCDLNEENYLSCCQTLGQMVVLLEAGANPNKSDKNGVTALLHIVQNGHGDYLERVRLLLKSGADPNAVDTNGRTALHLLAGRPEPSILPVMRLLISCGAEYDSLDSHGQTPFFMAAGASHNSQILDHLKLLMEAGADIHVRTKWGMTPLHQSVHAHQRHRERMLPVIQWMVDNGAVPEAVDKRGFSPRDFTTDASVLEILK